MNRVRKLTAGERLIVASIYGEAIDTNTIELRRRKWWPFQPHDVVMAPCGHVHFHPRSDLWREDFSLAGAVLRGLFVHEMCHIWQSQQGLFLPLRRLPFARYAYTLKPGKPLKSYGIEQQAEIVARTYLMREGELWMSADDADAHEQLVRQIVDRPGHGKVS